MRSSACCLQINVRGFEKGGFFNLVSGISDDYLGVWVSHLTIPFFLCLQPLGLRAQWILFYMERWDWFRFLSSQSLPVFSIFRLLLSFGTLSVSYYLFRFAVFYVRDLQFYDLTVLRIKLGPSNSSGRVWESFLSLPFFLCVCAHSICNYFCFVFFFVD